MQRLVRLQAEIAARKAWTPDSAWLDSYQLGILDKQVAFVRRHNAGNP